MLIKIGAEEVWETFYKDPTAFCGSVTEIASEEEYGISVYLSNEMGYPWVTVLCDDDICEDIAFVSKDECSETMKDIYNTYLTGSFINGVVSEESDDELSDEAMYRREDDLDDAFGYLLSVITEDKTAAVPSKKLTNKEIDEIAESLKEHTLRYLYKKFGLRIYRPMVFEDENGKDYVDPYPYDSLMGNPKKETDTQSVLK